MSSPLVSIICLCYNHERFIKEALDSVLTQTYANLEIIVVDDCSTDNSRDIIAAYCLKYPQIKFISTGANSGNCAAFNKGWRSSQGDFVIDFATDDILLPDRVEKQVNAFQSLDESYGVVYTDALYIDDHSKPLKYHYQRDKNGQITSFTPSGDIFKDLLSKYFICPPTMMMRRSVFEELKGYDATLSYEDFDFWIRSSRTFKYYFLDAVTTKRRLHGSSLSKGFYKPGSKLLQTTAKVCEKAAGLVQNKGEKLALVRRLKFEARHAFLTKNYSEAGQFLKLLNELKALSMSYKVLSLMNDIKLNLSFVRKVYYRLKYNE